jgi:hypothetical protein
MAIPVDNSQLLALKKDQVPTQAKTLSAGDVEFLVETLSEKDDKLRYNAFLLLQAHSKGADTVYAHWDKLAKKLDSDNSYQRSLGVMILAENVRWDSEGKFAGVIGKYFACCMDEKFITARQTIQALGEVVKATGKYNKAIAEGLAGLDFSKYKENQQSLLKRDVAAIQKLLAKKR